VRQTSLLCIGGYYSSAAIQTQTFVLKAYLQGRPICREGLSAGSAYLQGGPICRERLSAGKAYLQEAPICREGLSAGSANVQGRPICRERLSAEKIGLSAGKAYESP